MYGRNKIKPCGDNDACPNIVGNHYHVKFSKYAKSSIRNTYLANMLNFKN